MNIKLLFNLRSTVNCYNSTVRREHQLQQLSFNTFISQSTDLPQIGLCYGFVLPTRYVSSCNKRHVPDYITIFDTGRVYFKTRMCCLHSFYYLVRSLHLSTYSLSSTVPLLMCHHMKVRPNSHVNGNSSFLVNSGCFQSTYTTTGENPDFESLAKKVIEAGKKINVMAGSVPVVKVKTVLENFHSQGFVLDEMMQVLAQKLQLLTREPESLAQLTERLLVYGLKSDTIVDILNNLPNHAGNVSFKNMQTLIEDSFNHLRAMGFTERKLLSVLESEPGILFTDSKTCTSVLSKLKGLFSTVDALSCVKNCPNILSDPWRDTNRKFDYVYFKMGYKQQEMLKSCLFQHSLEHIQDRHIFLVRAGFFVHVKEKEDPKLNPNPQLQDVIDTSNTFFAQSLGQVTVEEYQTYLKMREYEREQEEEVSEEEESEEEESEEEEEGEYKHVYQKLDKRNQKKK